MATTTQAKHTPGPWNVSAIDGRTIQHEAGAWAASTYGGRDTGERIPRYQVVATVLYRGPEETQANAALIAAAPDLLADLRQIVEDLAEAGLDRNAEGEIYGSIAEAWDTIRRATGEQ